MKNLTEFAPTEKTKVNRAPQRGTYDRATIYSILDEGLICHVGFAVDGQPFVIPTIHWRVEDDLYLHGSPASRMMGAVGSGVSVCVTVTLLDGLVLARSAFHHSMNYRSAVVIGKGELVTDQEEKLRVLNHLVDHVVPGRTGGTREPNEKELQITDVVKIPILEASAKIRTGPPMDAKEDYGLPYWAGVLPLQLTPGELVPDPDLDPAITPPEHVTEFSRS